MNPYFEAELMRRMNKARDQGWSEGDVQKSAAMERAVNQQNNAASAEAQPKNTGASGLGGLALDLIPFGRVAEKAFTGRGNEITPGEVGMETALTFLPFGRIAKGAVAAGKTVAGVGKTVAGATARKTAGQVAKATTAKVQAGVQKNQVTGQAAATATAKDSGLLQKVGERFSRTATIAPNSALQTAKSQKDLIQQIQRSPSLRGSGTRKFQEVDKAIGGLTSEVDDLLEGVKTTIPGKKYDQTIRSIRSGIKDSNERRNFDRIYDNARKKVFGSSQPTAKASAAQKPRSSPKKKADVAAIQLNSMRREMNRQSSGAFTKLQKGTPLTAQEQAIMTLRDELGGMIESVTPEGVRPMVKETNRQIAGLLGGRAEFKDLSEQKFAPFGLALPGVSTLVPQATQAVADYAGRTINKLGGDSALARITRQAGGQAGRRIVAGALGVRSPQQASGTSQNPNDLLTQSSGAATSPNALLGGGSAATSTSSADSMTQQYYDAAQRAIAAGDIESANKLVEDATKIAKLESSMGGSSGPNVTKVTAQQYGLAQTGQQAANQLRQLLANDPGTLSRTATPGRNINILGIGGAIANSTNTADFDAIGYNIADTILRLRTGAQANESEVKNLQTQLMPRANDSSETVKLKLNQIDSIFNSITGLANGSYSSSGTDSTSDLLTQLNSAYGY